MKHHRSITTAFLVMLATVTAGCQIERVFYRPQMLDVFEHPKQSQIVLAASFMQQVPPDQPTQTDHKPQEPPLADKETKPDPETLSNDDTPTKRPYTAPGQQFQRFAVIALGLTTFGTSDVSGLGKEVSESQVMSTAVLAGLPGLTAPSPIVNNVLAGRPGLQQGFAIGLGPASDRNIFTATTNPLSGTNGRCTDLINAGFFGGNRSACTSRFRR
jgi:hypothetical protein